TGNQTVLVSDQLVSLMNGTAYAYTNVTIDPRLPEICIINDGDTEYKGAVNGTAGVAADGSGSNTDLGENNFYTGMKSPIVLISYAEVKFIEAEAQFLANGGTATSVGSNATCYAAYMEGITANMDKMGISEEDRDLYLSDPLVDVGEVNLTLQLIMKEKFIAMFLNPESFTDYRRYDFDPNVFNGLELPEDHHVDRAGQWVRRASYPSSEFSRNGDNVEAVQKDVTVPVWWDN
ncbi:MAG: SusD/RagB family nutrient-binding outer membrane lipoprotein, partial [Bacteroidota bacterium]